MFDFRECFILFLFAEAINKICHITSWGDRPRPVFIGGFPDFPKSRYSPRMLVC